MPKLQAQIRPHPLTAEDVEDIIAARAMSWGKVIAIIAPLLASIITSAWLLGTQAAERDSEVAIIKMRQTQAAETSMLVLTKIEAVQATLAANALERKGFEERLIAQRQLSDQLWSVIEVRLTRIENKIDKGK